MHKIEKKKSLKTEKVWNNTQTFNKLTLKTAKLHLMVIWFNLQSSFNCLTSWW